MKKFTLIILAMIICSCSQQWYQRRDIKKLDALSIQQPSEFLRLSDLINPCFKGIPKSDTVTEHDTSYTKGDTLKSFQHDTLKLTIKLPGKVITNKLTIHDTIPDTRKIAALQARLSDCSTGQTTSLTQLADEKAISKHRLWWIIGLSVAIVAFIVIKVYSFFSGGGIASSAKKII